MQHFGIHLKLHQYENVKTVQQNEKVMAVQPIGKQAQIFTGHNYLSSSPLCQGSKSLVPGEVT